MIMATELLNQRIKDRYMSLRVHVKACASVCEKDTLVFTDISEHTSLTFPYPNMRISKCNVFKLRGVPKAFDTTMRS